jgi:hypothetical protein
MPVQQLFKIKRRLLNGSGLLCRKSVMRCPALSVLILLVLSSLLPHCALASGTSEGKTLAESAECLDEALTRGIAKGNYNRQRGLAAYVIAFEKSFTGDLKNLGPNDLILDAGGGKGFAGESYVNENPNGAKVIVVSYEAPPSDLVERRLAIADRFTHLHGSYFETIPEEKLGEPKVITDLMGVFTYTDRPDQILKEYLHLLAPGGSIYIDTADADDNPSTVGNQTLISWLSECKNLKIDRKNSGSVRISIEDENQPVVIPELKLVSPGSNMVPPERKFAQLDTSITVPPKHVLLAESATPKTVPDLINQMGSLRGNTGDSLIRSFTHYAPTRGTEIPISDLVHLLEQPMSDRARNELWPLALSKSHPLSESEISTLAKYIPTSDRARFLAHSIEHNPGLSPQQIKSLANLAPNPIDFNIELTKSSVKRDLLAWEAGHGDGAHLVAMGVSHDANDAASNLLKEVIRSDAPADQTIAAGAGKIKVLSPEQFKTFTMLSPSGAKRDAVIDRLLPALSDLRGATIVDLAAHIPMSPREKNDFLFESMGYLNNPSPAELSQIVRASETVAGEKNKVKRRAELLNENREKKGLALAAKVRNVLSFSSPNKFTPNDFIKLVSLPKNLQDQALRIDYYFHLLPPLRASDVISMRSKLDPKLQAAFTLKALPNIADLDKTTLGSLAQGMVGEQIILTRGRQFIGN